MIKTPIAIFLFTCLFVIFLDMFMHFSGYVADEQRPCLMGVSVDEAKWAIDGLKEVAREQVNKGR